LRNAQADFFRSLSEQRCIEEQGCIEFKAEVGASMLTQIPALWRRIGLRDIIKLNKLRSSYLKQRSRQPILLLLLETEANIALRRIERRS
jgi:hypothetical protein